MKEYLQELNEMQYAAATADSRALLIMAGAGSGKTKTLVSRVAHLVDSGTDPSSILLLTFTNKAADEMKERAARILGVQKCPIDAGTFHSFCVRILRKYGRLIGLDSKFAILPSGDEADAINIVKVKLNMQDIRSLPNAKLIAGYISASANRSVPLSEAVPKKYRESLPEIAKIAEGYEQYRREGGYVTYDDMQGLVIKLLKEHPAEARLPLARQYGHILVDEYQDTNLPQDEILTLLRKDGGNIAVVGDDMQSIYGFRGAEVRNIRTFPGRYPGCRVVTLSENYRSVQGILDEANGISRISGHWSGKRLKAARGRGDAPVLMRPRDEAGEAAAAAGIVSAMHAQGARYSDICVMARNSRSFGRLEMLLRRDGVPFEKRGGAKLMDSPAVKDAVAVLRLLADPKDELSWFRVLKFLEGVGNVYAQKIAGKCHEEGFPGLISDASEHPKRKYVPQIRELYGVLMGLSGKDYREALPEAVSYYLRKRADAVEHMRTKSEENRLAMADALSADREKLREFMEIAGEYDDLNRFLDDAFLDNAAAPGDGEDRLVLSTIHSSKGLEFGTVILIGAVSGVSPREPERGSREFEEELRCHYVAVTRAKDRLIVLSPRHVMTRGISSGAQMSRYLSRAELRDAEAFPGMAGASSACG